MAEDKVAAPAGGGLPFRVLVVDDEALYARAIARSLSKQGFESAVANSAADAMKAVRDAPWDVILLDHKLPDGDGIQMIPALIGLQKAVSIIVMTAFEAIPNAIQAIRNGAEDYKVKQTSIQPLVDAVMEIHLRRTACRTQTSAVTGLVGESPLMKQVAIQIERVAPSTATVLLTGETGSGKEVAARAIHRLSGREKSPFVALDCASLPSHLVESLLFGHERGAFTGADQMRTGAFQEAGDGTIFLDEIGEMPQELQTRLLRVIESRSFKRVGSNRELPMEARVIAATNRDLASEVEAGRFRLDLFQRLSVFPINLPPLKKRGGDVLVLAGIFLSEICRTMGVGPRRLSAATEECLMAYDFPGNVRELKNIMERAVILTDSVVIEPSHLPDRVRNPYRRVDTGRIAPPASGDQAPVVDLGFVPGVDTLEAFEDRLIREVLERAGGNRSEAARMLGISRFALLRRLEKSGRDA